MYSFIWIRAKIKKLKQNFFSDFSETIISSSSKNESEMSDKIQNVRKKSELKFFRFS